MFALRAARAALVLSFAGALALLVLHAVPGTAPTWLPGLVPSVILLLVTGIGALVSAYAVTNLQGQRRLGRFAALEVLAVAGLATAVLSPNLVLLAAGWTVGGLAVAALVAHAGTDEARAAGAAVRIRLLAGDVALWAAVLTIGVGLHTWQVAELPAAVAAGHAQWVVLAAVLVVVAGAARSALVPAHRWLPETAAAPSPVSALLHAGLANGVGVLALLLWPVVTASAWARGLLLVAAVATVALGTAQLRTRPDVKGRLAASTSAQMGYLGVQVALGLPAAVLAHLVGHGLWKASLFLGAGGTVGRERATAPVTTEPRSRALALAGDVALGAGLVLLLAQVPLPWGPALLEGPAALVPVGVAALAAVVAVRSARLSGHGRRSAAAGVVLLAVSAYVLALRWLTPVVDGVVAPATPRWGEAGALLVSGIVVTLAALVVVGWRVDRAASRGAHPRLAALAARTSLPVSTLDEVVRGRAEVPVAELAPSTAATAEGARAREAVRAASDVVAPVWPLDAFVASSPLAGLEGFVLDDALTVAARSGGASTGMDPELLARAVDSGRLSYADIDDALVAAGLPRGPEVSAAGRTLPRVMVARHLVLDPRSTSREQVVRSPLDVLETAGPRGRRAAWRARVVGHHLAAQAAGSTSWPVPQGGPWAALRADVVGLDSALWVDGAARAVASLPERPEDAVAVLLDRLRVPASERVALLGRVLARDPGWPAHLLWRARVGRPLLAGAAEGGASDAADQPAEDLVHLVAARLALEVVTLEAHAEELLSTDGSWPTWPETVVDLAGRRARALLRGAAALGVEVRDLSPEEAEALVEVVAEVDALGLDRVRRAVWEESWRGPVVASVAARAAQLVAGGEPVGAAARADVEAQVVTCIDVRSERLRRALERTGPWETFGFAGFFGIPLVHVAPSGAVTERCPAILRPSVTVTEQAGPAGPSTWVATDSLDAVHAVESRPVAPFALAEASGWLVGPAAVARTAFPAGWERTADGVSARSGAPRTGELHVIGDGYGFALDEAVELAAGFLGAAGMERLAPLVVLAGHGGHAANNPHVAAYDCGACGGQAGDVSARAMVAALNDPRVRAALAGRGTVVPEGTWFVAALHDTTREHVEVLDAASVPPSHAPVLARLVADLAAATDAVVAERYADLPQARRTDSPAARRRELDRRAVDWAQPRPEWGLAGNAAIVIGPRALTETLDLQGRAFLQSYRADLDPEGAALEALLTGPLVVAQWINLQYWCSTVDPERFGAGDKTTHNVLGAPDGAPAALSAVLTGARGDVRIGLPWQAVSAHAPVDGRWVDGPPRHEPLRLLAVVCATPEAIDAVLARHPEVARLALGEWISLVSVDPSTGRLRRLDPSQGWVEVQGDPLPARADRSGEELPQT